MHAFPLKANVVNAADDAVAAVDYLVTLHSHRLVKVFVFVEVLVSSVSFCFRFHKQNQASTTTHL